MFFFQLIADGSFTQQRKQSFEEHDDGCLDHEVNVMGFLSPSSQPIRESDPQVIYSVPRRSKPIRESDPQALYSNPTRSKRSALYITFPAYIWILTSQLVGSRHYFFSFFFSRGR